MTKEQIEIVLQKHKDWLLGSGGKCADLSAANLSGADLSGADLSWANLSGVNLNNANLSDSNLSGANLSDANLRGANLKWADFSGVNLSAADLSAADFNRTNLSGANLRLANLSGADLRLANICNANISGTNGAVCRMDFGGWSICIRPDKTSIGCETRDNSDWLKWTYKSKDIVNMHPNAPRWWRTYGAAVKETIRVVIAKSKEVTE